MITLTLPVPPSMNAYWRSITINGRARVLISREGRTYQKLVGNACLLANVGEPTTKPIAITARIYRPAKRGDLDNYAKSLLDSLKARAFADDSQVVEMHLFRHDDKANPRAEVEISEILVGGALQRE